ncbi:3747_t:CDS:2, partial [Acaulospora colombiana]
EDEGDDLSLGDELPRISNASSPLSSLPPSPFLPPIAIPRGTRSRPLAGRVLDSSPSASSAPDPSVINEVISLPPPIIVPELIPFKDKLANTILLQGPQGSGKTAAVYACAEELGWKVFEFYPGIGRRSGGGFMNEVGGTGENHRVGGMATILGKADDIFKPASTLGFLTSPTKGGARVSQPPLRESSQEITDVRQSLILVEEADILFQSDGNFWPTLINFIRTSRRPIILTCNDPALIPVDDLPLQTVLEFKYCEEGLGTSYLQAISIAEDRPITREYAKDILMEQAVYFAMEADIPDQPMLPDPSQGRVCHPDLKRAINHLQFQLVGGLPLRVEHNRTIDGLGHWAEEPAIQPQQYVDSPPLTYRKISPNSDLENMLQLSELIDSISFSDAFVDRRLRSILNLESIDRHGPSGDDVLGHTLLNKVLEPEEAFGVALDPRDEVMAVDVAYHARFLFEQ